MDLSPQGLMEFARSAPGQKLLRYSAVSAIGIVMTVTLFTIINFISLPGAGHGLFVAEHHVRPAISNIIAVGLTTIPTYYLNRAWVWGKRGKSHLGREVLPFWVFSFAGLGLSTLLVAVVNHGQHGKPSATHQLELIVAQLAGFGLLWVARFFVLDKLMFGKTHIPHDSVDDAAHEVLTHHHSASAADAP